MKRCCVSVALTFLWCAMKRCLILLLAAFLPCGFLTAAAWPGERPKGSGSEAEAVRRSAAEALEKTGPTSPVDAPATPPAVAPAGGQVIDGKTVRQWIAWTQPEASADQRYQATRALGRFRGADAKAAVPVLMRLLEDKSLQGTAIVSLGQLGTAAEEAIPAVAKLADLKAGGTINPSGRQEIAVEALAHMGAKAIPALTHVAQDRESTWRSRYAAVWGLIWAARNGDQEVLPVLTRLLQDQDSKLRINAAFGLGCVAPEAVWDAVHDKAPAIRADAARGLIMAATDTQRFTRVLPTLRKFLKDSDPGVQAAVARGLSIQNLRSLAADPDQDVRSLVARELAVKLERQRQWRDKNSGPEGWKKSGK